MQTSDPSQNNVDNRANDEFAQAFKRRLKLLLFHLAQCDNPSIEILARERCDNFEEFKPRINTIQKFFGYPNNTARWLNFAPNYDTNGPHISVFEKYIIPALRRTFTDHFDERRQLAIRYLLGELNPSDTLLPWIYYRQARENLQSNLHRNEYLEWEVDWDLHRQLVERSYEELTTEGGSTRSATEPVLELTPYSYLLPAFDYFAALVNQNRQNVPTPEEIRSQQNWSSEQAAEALRRAFFGNYIKIKRVNRDKELEKKLLRHENLIKYALVADIPDKVDSLLVRSEMIANLMGTMFETRAIVNSTIACGRGYVLERLATGYTKPTELTATVTWTPLVASVWDIQQDPTNSDTHMADPRESTGVAQLFCSKHPGSQSLTLPYIPPVDNLREEVEDARHANADNLTITQQQARQVYDLLNNIGQFRNKDQLWIILTTSGTLDEDRNFSQADGETYSFNRLAELTFKYIELLEQQPLLQEEFGGLILGQILNRQGEHTSIDKIRNENDRLVYSIGVDYIKKLVADRHPTSWMMSTGEKADSVYTALKSGIVNSLCIDSQIARSLLERLGSSDSE